MRLIAAKGKDLQDFLTQEKGACQVREEFGTPRLLVVWTHQLHLLIREREHTKQRELVSSSVQCGG
jgi:hypothetical protein